MTNFFIPDEKEPFRTNSIFGLCDNEDENPAYSDTDDSKNWQATVENSDNLEVRFQSIDKRIVIKDYEGNQESNWPIKKHDTSNETIQQCRSR